MSFSEFISAFVTNPFFRLFFGAAAVLFILGILMYFGFNSVTALNYGVYDMMIIVFLFALSIMAEGVSISPNSAANAMFASFYPNLLSPLVDMFDMNSSAGLDIWKLLYEAGKILMLAMIIELFETILDFLRAKFNRVWVWWLGEATVTVFSVFLFTFTWNWMEKHFQEQMQIVVPVLFIVVVILTIVLGLLSEFKGWNLLSDEFSGELFLYLLISLILVLATVVFAVIIAVFDLKKEMDAFFQNTMHAASAQAVAMTGGVLLMLIAFWYVLYKLVRDKQL